MVIAGRKYSKVLSITIVVVIYLITLFIVVSFLDLVPFDSSIYRVLALDVLATVIVFGFSFVFKNSSIYDPYWSVVPPVVVLYLVSINPDGNFYRQAVVVTIVAFWGIRLTFNWLKGWDGMHKQDWRYIKLSNDTGKFYWLVSFLGIHLLPTLVVFAGLLPCWFILSSTEPLNIWDGVVATITIGFIAIEWIADWQLSRFKKQNIKDAFINEGLWAFSRHPNYLGEIGFWLGIFLFLLSSKVYSGIWSVIGFLLMVMLFNFISIPMMDKRNIEKRAGYSEYMKSVPALLPAFKRKSKI